MVILRQVPLSPHPATDWKLVRSPKIPWLAHGTYHDTLWASLGSRDWGNSLLLMGRVQNHISGRVKSWGMAASVRSSPRQHRRGSPQLRLAFTPPAQEAE